MPFWDEVVDGVVSKAPEVAFRKVLIDALCAEIIENPQRFDVIVASNLFGDILSDIAAAMVGSLGIAPSGNINPERTSPSMFEPVHGSAPDIAGKGIANPIAAVWSAAMMMKHLGYSEISQMIMTAIESTLKTPETRTADLGGNASTESVTTALITHLDEHKVTTG